MLIRCCDDGRAEGESEGGRERTREHWREERGVKRNEEELLEDRPRVGGGGELQRQTRRGMWRGGTRRRKEKMTGSGAVIHFLTARTAAENRSNPLV